MYPHLKSLLLALHLLPTSPWEPPTLLSSLLTSPLQSLISLLYTRLLLPLRGHPFHPPPGRRPIRIVCLSDTHGLTLPREKVPEGDVLVHCGDLTVDGGEEEVRSQVEWLGGFGHRWKVVVGGNHDGWLETVGDGMVGEKGEMGIGGWDWKGVEYLGGRALEIEVEGGRRLNLYGWGGVPWIGEGHAMQYKPEEQAWKGRVPEETDVLITHTPPRHHLDLSLGCPSLLDEVWRVKPRLHVFGHVHHGHGREAVYYDECQRAYEALMSMPARGPLYDLLPGVRWVAAFNVLRYGVGSILWKWLMLGPGTNNGGLMVNASVMYGNTGVLGNPVTVVDL
ncbi:Metallo-dependent phosphatase-like protein [Staphylotrichum tortipilum]|uniref:Metallo-dependent phosphatase-like protein n=1 Tax=Staphylotrichum tortipilum TaxID=2831512 RepID=A0AAN6RRT5_9PEZI|nr:Metallo-dependent phosphatase-like protein [Staphylotrichum longicolle]